LKQAGISIARAAGLFLLMGMTTTAVDMIASREFASSNNRWTGPGTRLWWRAASALRYFAPAAGWMRLSPAAQLHR